MKIDLLNHYIKNFKPYLIGVGVLLVAVFIYTEVLIPEWDAIQSKNGEITKKNQTISELRDSIQTINAMNANDIDNSLKVVNAALPSGKDILVIYNAMLTAASASNVSIKDFSLKIGDLYANKIQAAPASGVGGVDAAGQLNAVEVTLSVNGSDPKQYFTFSDTMYKIFPLAEVSMFNIGKDQGKFGIRFYYKPYDPTAIASQIFIPGLSARQESIASQLKQWENTLQMQASLSAVPSPASSAGVLKK